MHRINDKRIARKMFDKGYEIVLVPSNCLWWSKFSMTVSNSMGKTFDSTVNEFEYYVCNSELGKYTKYYYRQQVL